MGKHFMIDLETMGTRPNSAIVSIGVAHFDADRIVDKFFTAVSLQDCLDKGLVQDQATVDWWAKQPAEARADWERPDAPKLLDALTAMSEFIGKYSIKKQCCPWGNGSDFDLVLLTSAYRALDADTPWMFYNHHCLRTIRNLFPTDRPAWNAAEGAKHTALADAVHQVEYLHAIMRKHDLNILK